MNQRRFISRPIEAIDAAFDNDASGRVEPALPAAFHFDDETLTVRTQLRSWRTNKDDRGDTYVKRHWFEFETADGRRAIVYFDRGAKRGAPRWWLYTIYAGEPA
jgi:hypothetical protein